MALGLRGARARAGPRRRRDAPPAQPSRGRAAGAREAIASDGGRVPGTLRPRLRRKADRSGALARGAVPRGAVGGSSVLAALPRRRGTLSNRSRGDGGHPVRVLRLSLEPWPRFPRRLGARLRDGTLSL